MERYDPNIVWSRQAVRITLQRWDYTQEYEVIVGGNCQGYSIFDAALHDLYDTFYNEKTELAKFKLVNKNGDILICEDDEDRWTSWLEQFVVKMEIVNVIPEKR